MISGSLQPLQSGSQEIVPEVDIDPVDALLNLPQRAFQFVINTVSDFGS